MSSAGYSIIEIFFFPIVETAIKRVCYYSITSKRPDASNAAHNLNLHAADDNNGLQLIFMIVYSFICFLLQVTAGRRYLTLIVHSLGLTDSAQCTIYYYYIM